jgi:predicted PhzF superfamily epimerase YddE/YHI9
VDQVWTRRSRASTMLRTLTWCLFESKGSQLFSSKEGEDHDTNQDQHRLLGQWSFDELVGLEEGSPCTHDDPPARVRAVDDVFVGEVAAVLGISRAAIIAAEWVDNGPGWVGILLEDSESVLALEPDLRRQSGTGPLDIGVIAPHPDGNEVDFEVRAFFADDKSQFIEDPVTGSLNASLAQWLIGSGLAPDSYAAAQGTAIGRGGRIHITRQESDVWVAGSTVTLVSGEIG